MYGRSSDLLRCIQLIACVECPHLKEYGFDKILQPFIRDVNTLCNVRIHINDVKNNLFSLAVLDGITVTVTGQDHKFNGTVLLMLGDTLAAHDLGGFKLELVSLCESLETVRQQRK